MLGEVVSLSLSLDSRYVTLILCTALMNTDDQDLFKGSEADQMKSMLNNDLGSYVQDAVNAGAASSSSGLQKVLEIQRDWILNKAAGISENFDYTFGKYTHPSRWLLADHQTLHSATTPGSSSPSAEDQSRSPTTNRTLPGSLSIPDSSPTDSTP
jgi:hypothetical protein